MSPGEPNGTPPAGIPPVAGIEAVLARLPEIRAAVAGMQDILLANLVMIGEIPAPTGEEGARVQMILERLSEAGLQNCSGDEQGNGYGVLFGERGASNLLVSAHADTFVAEAQDQTVEVGPEQIVGPFVGDNSLALAAMVSLPVLLERLQVRLKSNVVLHAAAKAFGRGNLAGLKHFLDHSTLPIHAGLCLEGVQLGRLNYTGLGVLRGEIECRLPDDYQWAHYGATGAIIPLNDVITRLNKIALPRRPRTSLVLGSIEGGIAYYNIARQATLRFEVRGEDSGLLKQIRRQIEDIVADVAAQAGVKVR
ncbi:MAG: peptidase dimerization domain-containing protein, partial [Bryobacter sp.]|nr:peptidase dimerization domain-containing protein [Bryobacter sp.]